MPNTYRIQVQTSDFAPEIGHAYNDCQYFNIDSGKTIDEFILENEDAIKAETARRIENWKQAVLNPPEPVEPSEEQLIAEKASIEEQIALLQSRKVELTDKVSAMEALKVVPIEEKPLG